MVRKKGRCAGLLRPPARKENVGITNDLSTGSAKKGEMKKESPYKNCCSRDESS